MAVIQCSYCGENHVAKVCKNCDTLYCQKYAETHMKGNGELCSKECTIIVMDRWKKLRGE